MEKLNLKTIAERVTSPTPSFFKKVIRLGIIAGSIGLAIIGAPATLAAAGVTIVLPVLITTIGQGLVIAGVVAGAVAKTTVEDSAK